MLFETSPQPTELLADAVADLAQGHFSQAIARPDSSRQHPVCRGTQASSPFHPGRRHREAATSLGRATSSIGARRNDGQVITAHDRRRREKPHNIADLTASRLRSSRPNISVTPAVIRLSSRRATFAVPVTVDTKRSALSHVSRTALMNNRQKIDLFRAGDMEFPLIRIIRNASPACILHWSKRLRCDGRYDRRSAREVPQAPRAPPSGRSGSLT